MMRRSFRLAIVCAVALVVPCLAGDDLPQGRDSVATCLKIDGALLERGKDGDSTVRTEVVKGSGWRDLLRPIYDSVERQSTVYTDELPSFTSLNVGYVHNVINHAEAYVDGDVHTNGIESSWSLVKRALKGTLVSVEPFHLFRYLDEQMYRFNIAN